VTCFSLEVFLRVIRPSLSLKDYHLQLVSGASFFATVVACVPLLRTSFARYAETSIECWISPSEDNGIARIVLYYGPLSLCIIATFLMYFVVLCWVGRIARKAGVTIHCLTYLKILLFPACFFIMWM